MQQSFRVSRWCPEWLDGAQLPRAPSGRHQKSKGAQVRATRVNEEGLECHAKEFSPSSFGLVVFYT